MPLMFEVRFAYALHREGKRADYEYCAGVGDSTVEFRVSGPGSWLIELVSIRTSNAASNAITQRGLIYEQNLSSDNPNVAESPEAEMITAQQKIGEKVFSKGVPTKFPFPEENVYHLIMVDARGYLDQGGDVLDYKQMAYGASGIPARDSWCIHYWKSKNKLEPIKGLFIDSCPLRAASFVRERIHFLGFVCEREYDEGEIQRRAYYFPNPHLLTNIQACQAYDTYPLKKLTERTHR